MSRSRALAAIEEERRLRRLLPRLRLEGVAAEAVLSACRQLLELQGHLQRLAAGTIPVGRMIGLALGEEEAKYELDPVAFEATVMRLERGERELTRTEAEQIYAGLLILGRYDRDWLESGPVKLSEPPVEKEVLEVLSGVLRSFLKGERTPAG